MRVGCDVVEIGRFSEKLKHEGVMGRMFLDSEVSPTHTDCHYAGVFAAKEALVKALDLEAGQWLRILIDYEESGRPRISFIDGAFSDYQFDVSISHDGSYAFAVVLAFEARS